MNSILASEPAWQALYEVTATQEGLFTTRQAATAGYSPPLLAHHQKAGRIVRIRHGIYRLVHFPPGEQEELVAAWLWTDAQGVLSHQTALCLHDISDVLPAQIHLTLPLAGQPDAFASPRSGEKVRADRGRKNTREVWRDLTGGHAIVRIAACLQTGIGATAEVGIE